MRLKKFRPCTKAADHDILQQDAMRQLGQPWKFPNLQEQHQKHQKWPGSRGHS
jgi:hypothetical protein